MELQHFQQKSNEIFPNSNNKIQLCFLEIKQSLLIRDSSKSFDMVYPMQYIFIKQLCNKTGRQLFPQ